MANIQELPQLPLWAMILLGAPLVHESEHAEEPDANSAPPPAGTVQ
jgi:hypothetical protein